VTIVDRALAWIKSQWIAPDVSRFIHAAIAAYPYPTDPMTGAEFLKAMDDAVAPATDDEVKEMIADIQGEPSGDSGGFDDGVAAERRRWSNALAIAIDVARKTELPMTADQLTAEFASLTDWPAPEESARSDDQQPSDGCPVAALGLAELSGVSSSPPPASPPAAVERRDSITITSGGCPLFPEKRITIQLPDNTVVDVSKLDGAK